MVAVSLGIATVGSRGGGGREQLDTYRENGTHDAPHDAPEEKADDDCNWRDLHVVSKNLGFQYLAHNKLWWHRLQ